MLIFRYSNRQQSVLVHIILVQKSELKKKAKTFNHVLHINEKWNKHAQRAFLMYHAAYKLEFQPFNRSYSQLTFFIFLFVKRVGWVIDMTKEQYSVID